MKNLTAWFSLLGNKRRSREFNRGFDSAAGELLRHDGRIDPSSHLGYEMERDDFDLGIDAACEAYRLQTGRQVGGHELHGLRPGPVMREQAHPEIGRPGKQGMATPKI